MGAYGGDVTADLRALLEVHCPDIVDEVMAAYEVARSAAQTLGDGEQAADGTGPRWSRLTLGQIPGVQQMADAASVPIEAVASALKVIAGLLDVLTAFLLEIPDPIRAMILAAYEILKEVIDDLLSSGCYLYTDLPGVTSWKTTVEETAAAAAEPSSWKAGDYQAAPPMLGAFESWASTFRRSFDDPGDGDRPIFSEGATVEAVFVMATAPGMADIVPLLHGLGALLDEKALVKALEAFEHMDLPGFEDWLHPDPDDWRVRGRPTGPNWRSWKLRDIAPPDYPLRELERVPELLLAILSNIEGIVSLLKDLIKAIRAKIDVLLEIAETLQRVIEMIQALTATGLHVLVVVTHDGVEGLVDGFLEAADRPGTREDGEEVPGLVIGGTCLLAGTSTALYAAGPALVWKLLGVDGPLEDARAALGDDVQRYRDELEAAGKPAVEAWDRMKEEAAEHAGTYREETLDQFERMSEALITMGPALGRSPQEIEDALRGMRADVMAQVEREYNHGRPLDPLVMAELLATRAARGRGRRSLAARTRDDS